MVPHLAALAIAHASIAVPPMAVTNATYLGGTTTDKILSMTVDAAGNVYVAGLTTSIDFPIENAAQAASGGATDAFVAKLDPSGTQLIYATYLGGSGIDVATGIAIDGAGNAYVAGYTESADFPVTATAVQTKFGGSYDAFVVKLSSDGTPLYATYLGGSGLDEANAIAVDAAGHAYVTGFTCSGDFPVANAFQTMLDGAPIGCFAAKDAFVAELDVNGDALVYSTYIGGGAQDEAKSIAVDAQGRAAIAGVTDSIDWPTFGHAISPHAGGFEAFAARFDATGALDYSTLIAGSGYDEADAIATRADGVMYVAGVTQSADFPLAGAFQSSLNGNQDAFVLALDANAPSAASLVWSSYLGGGDEDGARAIAVDTNGDAWVTGYTASLDFSLQLAAQSMLSGTQDAFVAQIDKNGVPRFSTFLGGDDVDDGWAIALGPSPSRFARTIRVAGVTSSSNLAIGAALQPSLRGAFDGFVAKLTRVP